MSSKPFAWKFFRQYLRLICAAVGRKASVKPDIVALRPSTLFKPLPESGEARRHFRRSRGLVATIGLIVMGVTAAR